MSEGFTSRAFRLTFTFSSHTRSYNSYISLPSDFWEGSARFEQLGLSAVPVEASLCWSLAPSLEEVEDAKLKPIVMETIGMNEDNDNNNPVEESEYIPFVVGTSVVASGIVKLSLVDGFSSNGGGSKNTIKLIEEKRDEKNLLRVIYNFRPEGNAVIIPSIPAILTPADFLSFIRDAKGIVDIRLVREASPGRYMALIRLHTRRHALRFVEQFSGLPFSSLEPTLCQVLWMAEIEFTTKVSTIVPLFDMADFKDTVHVVPSSFEANPAVDVSSCPVCLERLDSSVTGIITTICSHSYHCDCMSKWYDGSCPVCRFLLSEEDEAEGGNRCGECGCKENLWICLICGNLGCGRYRSRHAQSHAESSGHTFSLELETHRVWDYVGDNYVHRLVQNQEDGKLVEISHPGSPGPTSTSKKNEDPDYISSLLIAQLESQRVFYEEKLNALESCWSLQSKTAQSESNFKIEHLQTSIQALQLTHDSECSRMKNQIDRLSHQIETLKKEKAELQASLDAESTMLDRVMRNHAELEESIKAKDREIADLNDQISDLLMHIGGQKVIADSDMADQLRIGAISLVESSEPASAAPTKKPPSKGRRRK